MSDPEVVADLADRIESAIGHETNLGVHFGRPSVFFVPTDWALVTEALREAASPDRHAAKRDADRLNDFEATLRAQPGATFSWSEEGLCFVFTPAEFDHTKAGGGQIRCPDFNKALDLLPKDDIPF